MAVTKTHPIKSTLKAAIDYICNPEKTDGKLLVSSYGCAAETADIEFSWTRRHAIDKGTHLGRHLIQAFEPGEVTPEEAHEIGMQLAKEILGGKYEFVLTTHIDKNHIHNHLIFNAVSFTDYKHYHSNKRSYHYIRRTSDRICKEHGLSVIIPGKDKGKFMALGTKAVGDGECGIDVATGAAAGDGDTFGVWHGQRSMQSMSCRARAWAFTLSRRSRTHFQRQEMEPFSSMGRSRKSPSKPSRRSR